METTVIDRSTSKVSWKAGLVAAGVIGTLVLFVLAAVYPNFPGDEGAIQRFQALRTGWLDDLALAFASFGHTLVFLPVMAVLAGGLAITRRHADAFMVVAGLAVIALGNGLKELVDRPRPEYHMIGPDPSSLSFPSGHALLAVILGGMVVYLIEQLVKPIALRRGIQAGIILVVLAMGASRVYMGVHWPSDVIGSYVFGVTALVGLVSLRNGIASVR
ncbi:MAG: phosphatase PAP2 family protein [SAR202 cluster bacterium]|nr:phosphatase PAP2 family protein [SAR202 cluster bacterium]